MINKGIIGKITINGKEIKSCSNTEMEIFFKKKNIFERILDKIKWLFRKKKYSCTIVLKNKAKD